MISLEQRADWRATAERHRESLNRSGSTPAVDSMTEMELFYRLPDEGDDYYPNALIVRRGDGWAVEEA